MSTNSCACSASTDKFVYSFGGGSADGNGSMKNLLGGKGANLAEMARIGLPVPPGFTITTEVCTYYYDHGCTYPAQLDAQVKEGIARMEQILGRKFGDTEAMPLLVAVRSAAQPAMRHPSFSMAWMEYPPPGKIHRAVRLSCGFHPAGK